jgi:hypothetical protein
LAGGLSALVSVHLWTRATSFPHPPILIFGVVLGLLPSIAGILHCCPLNDSRNPRRRSSRWFSWSMSSSAPNGSSNTTTSLSGSANAGGQPSHLNMSTMGKAIDGQRKQAGSPMEPQQQRYVIPCWIRWSRDIWSSCPSLSSFARSLVQPLNPAGHPPIPTHLGLVPYPQHPSSTPF